MSNTYVNESNIVLSPSSGATTTHTFTYTPVGTAAQGHVLVLWLEQIGASKTFTACTGSGITTIGFSTTLNDTTNGVTVISWVGQSTTAGSPVTFTITHSSLAATSIGHSVHEFSTDYNHPTWTLAGTGNTANAASSTTWTTAAVSAVRGDLAICPFLSVGSAPAIAKPSVVDPLVFYGLTQETVVGGAYPSPAVATIYSLPQSGAAALNTNASYTMQLAVTPSTGYETQTILLRPAGTDPEPKRSIVSGYGGIF